MKKICRTCKKEYSAPPSRNLYFCSNKCYDKTGSKNPRWKGGKLISGGYVYIYKPDHPHAISLGYVLEHRLVVEKELGRYLKPSEVIHHINHNKSDNRLENLMFYDNAGKHTLENHVQRDNLGRFSIHSSPSSL